LPSLFETSRRLPTSATALTTCGQPNPDSRSSQGRRPRSPSFSSSCHAVLSYTLAGGESGDTRRAALRPSAETPVSVPPACTGLPDRDIPSNASPPGLAPRSIVRIDVHGSKDRAKDAVPLAHATISRACAGCMRLVRMPTAFPSSATFGHPLSPARRPPREDTRCVHQADRGLRSDDAPRRAPPSRKPGCLSPPRHAKDWCHSRRDCSLRPSRRLSRSRRPHPFPKLGGVFLIGHCKVTVRSPACP
jgi:hypothetical protein